MEIDIKNKIIENRKEEVWIVPVHSFKYSAIKI